MKVKIFKKIGKALASPTAFAVYGFAGALGTIGYGVYAGFKIGREFETVDDRKTVKKDAAVAAIPLVAGVVVSGLFIFKGNRKSIAAIRRIQNVCDKQSEKIEELNTKLFGNCASAAVGAEAGKRLTPRKELMEEDPDLFDQWGGKRIWIRDRYSGRMIMASVGEVYYAGYQLNKNFAQRDVASVNEFYYYLGENKMEIGDDTGWNRLNWYMEGFNYIPIMLTEPDEEGISDLIFMKEPRFLEELQCMEFPNDSMRFDPLPIQYDISSES